MKTMQRRKPFRWGKTPFAVRHKLTTLMADPRVTPMYSPVERMETRASLQRLHRPVAYHTVKKRKPT